MTSIVLLMWIALAGPDTAVVVRGSVAAADAHSACAAHFACEEPARVGEALEDARSLGIRCDDVDAACWQRFAAAEGFARVVVLHGTGAVTALVVEGGAAARTGSGSTAALALEQALKPQPPVPETGTAAPAIPAEAGPVVQAPVETDPTAGAEEPAQGPSLFWVGAGVSGGIGVLSAVGAVAVSLDLARSLRDAEEGRAPLEDYTARNAVFLSLTGVSALALLGAGGLLTAAVLSPEP